MTGGCSDRPITVEREETMVYHMMGRTTAFLNVSRETVKVAEVAVMFCQSMTGTIKWSMRDTLITGLCPPSSD